jgi:predicted TIM-barrel fold metal-dependent hydrolase
MGDAVGTRERIIDAWMQHPTAGFLSQPYFESLRRWAGSPEQIPEVPPELTIRCMDDAGVRIGLVCAWWGPGGPLIGNDEVASLVRAYPDRFIGVGSVDLSRPMEAVRELRRCVRELGFRAVRILPWLWNLPPDDRRYYPIYAECVELGIPFCLQVGQTGPLRPSEPGRPIPYLENVALEFPDLRIVGGHIGAPWASEMVFLARKFPNVYIDTSAYKSSRYPPELVAYLRGGGRKKVMFGSNYPMISAADCLRDLEALDLDAEVLRLFLHGNAERVFGIEAAA